MRSDFLILISFIVGIIFYEFNIPSISFSTIFLLIFIKKINKKNLLLFLIFSFSGYFSMLISEKNNTLNNKIDASKIISIEGEVISSKEKPFEKELFIKTKKIFTEKNHYEIKKKVIIKIKEKKQFLNGENLNVKVKKIEEINPPKNPFEFDYKKFMQRQGIFFSIISAETEKSKENINLKLFFSYLRKNVEKRIEKYTYFNPEGRELIKLLTLGSDDPPDFLRELGIKTGIYHLFIISGIHIVFLIFLLKLLFIPFQKLNNTKPKLFPFLILSILWFYNFLSGFRIPITRAVLMVSFYLISEILEREIDSFTSLILSCILLLFINPAYIYSVSFLLSFLSTGGILTIHKKLNIFGKNNFFVNLFLVSISAQIFILPILFYNFGYFYPLGLIYNLIFTPFVGLITVTSFTAIIIPFLFIPLNFIMSFFLKFLVFISNFSPKIFIYFPLSYVFLYYTIFSFSILKLRRKIYLLFIFIFFFSFCQIFNISNKKEIIFFSSKNPLILIQNKNKGILIAKGKFYEYEKWRNILNKILKDKKLNVEKIILCGNESIANLFWLSDLSKNFYITDDFEFPNNFYLQKVKIEKAKKRIKFYETTFCFKDGNIIIQHNKFKILILLNEITEKLSERDKIFLIIYPSEFKKNKKNEQTISKLKPFFYIIPRDIKKFENLKGLCNNYYLDKSAIILNLKTGLLEYWKNDKRKYRKN